MVSSQHRGPLVALALLCIMASCAAIKNPLTGSEFPFENCAMDPETARYSAYLRNYTQDAATKRWVMCWRIIVLDRAGCLVRNNYPKNTTRCCDAGLNKFKIWAANGCRGSVANYKVTSGYKNYTSSAYTWEPVGPGKAFTIVKFTPLSLNPKTADGADICVALKPPCETMQKLSPNGDSIEFALYDKKAITGGRHYECCPVGVEPAPDGYYNADGDDTGEPIGTDSNETEPSPPPPSVKKAPPPKRPPPKRPPPKRPPPSKQ